MWLLISSTLMQNVGFYVLFIQWILRGWFRAPVWKLHLLKLKCQDQNYCTDIIGLLMCSAVQFVLWWLLCFQPSAALWWSAYIFVSIHINFHCVLCYQRALPVGHWGQGTTSKAASVTLLLVRSRRTGQIWLVSITFFWVHVLWVLSSCLCHQEGEFGWCRALCLVTSPWHTLLCVRLHQWYSKVKS